MADETECLALSHVQEISYKIRYKKHVQNLVKISKFWTLIARYEIETAGQGIIWEYDSID